jgi:BolA protein
MEELWGRAGKKQAKLLLDFGTASSEALGVMTVAETIHRKLTAAFAPLELTVRDESARHEGHAGHRPGGETHFDVRIIAAQFEGLSRVERQRRIYAALDEEFRAGLHALSLKALTPAEAARQAG